ncbi:hypothetical protein [Vogesella sp. LIG4]|nr:hypothetical protein [Vogesella sp. LIG4]SCK13483.1 hypothetical protein PSELUDRAFT_1255 [Vogesella sp. LIG4]
MKLLRQLFDHLFSPRLLHVEPPLPCAEQRLEQLRHQADSLSRGRWV